MSSRQEPLTHPPPPPWSPWPPGPPGGFWFNQTPLEPPEPCVWGFGPPRCPRGGVPWGPAACPEWGWGAGGPSPGGPFPAPVCPSQARPIVVSVSRAAPLLHGTCPRWPSEEEDGGGPGGERAPDGSSPRSSPPCIPTTLGTRAISVLAGSFRHQGPLCASPGPGPSCGSATHVACGPLLRGPTPREAGEATGPHVAVASACGEQPVIHGAMGDRQMFTWEAKGTWS